MQLRILVQFLLILSFASAVAAENQLLTQNASYNGSTALYGCWVARSPLTDRNISNGGQAPSGTPQWIIDLGANNYTVARTDFAGVYQGQSNAVTNWSVEHSNDSTTWTAAVSNWNPGSSTGFVNASFSPVVGKRYWRFTMHSNSCPNGCWVDDFGLWGQSTPGMTRLTASVTYTGSSALYGNWAPARLTDGVVSNGGQNPSGTPQWVVDLGSAAAGYTINTTDFAGFYQGQSNAVTSWTVEYSNDSTTWTAAVSNWNPGSSTSLINTSFAAVTGMRYWRFTMNSNGCPNGCWVDDFGLWGTVTDQLLTNGALYTGSAATYPQANSWTACAPVLLDRNVSSGGQNPSGTPQWIVDLGSNVGAYAINMTDFAGQYQGQSNAVTNWSVEHSNDTTSWTAAVSNWNPGSSSGFVNTSFAPVVGKRYWRFTMHSNSCTNGCWVDDFGLWGSRARLLTANVTYTGSSALYGSWAPTRLTDRIIGGDGGQNPSGTPQWTIDLGAGANHTIAMTDFAGVYQGQSNAVTSWTVEYSNDSTTWTAAVSNWNPGSSTGFINNSFTPVVGKRYWRFTMHSNSCPNGCWVDDFGLWGW